MNNVQPSTNQDNVKLNDMFVPKISQHHVYCLRAMTAQSEK